MKNNKGFTLVEIIVVLVILAILAAATIPSMLGFVTDAKKKANSAEVRAVYLAAQSYAIEQIATRGTEAATLTAIAGEIDGNLKTDTTHPLYSKLNGDAAGVIKYTTVTASGVTFFGYTPDGGSYVTFTNGSGINFDPSPTT